MVSFTVSEAFGTKSFSLEYAFLHDFTCIIGPYVHLLQM